MSTSLTLKEVAEQALREKAELEAQMKYLRSQLGQMMQERRGTLRSPRSTSKQVDSDASDDESNSLGDSEEDAYTKRSRGHHRPQDRCYNDFKVDIPEFKGQLDPDIFLDWLQTVERVFEFKDIPKE